MSQLAMDFSPSTSTAEFLAPAGYTGLYGFHKYWGKKPPETVSFLVERLSGPNGLVFDPFLGSGAIARESFLRRRRFIGCDVNPAAIDLARLCLMPPSFESVSAAFRDISRQVQTEIEGHYALKDGLTASHFLWNDAELRSVWSKPKGQRARAERPPTEHDRVLYAHHEKYVPRNLRPLRIYQNSRINARAGMDWKDLFTGRALRSIELLRDAIKCIQDPDVRRALLLVLTAAVGQMSKMVFAIENRGKSRGATETNQVEVGSWVIGFWQPQLHFEVNAWNCFSNKASKLLRGLREERSVFRVASVTEDPLAVVDGSAKVALIRRDAKETACLLPARSVELIVTDPPHGDRIPYLEMSEIWNAILEHEPDFSQELVVSNARERGKDLHSYAMQLRHTLEPLASALAEDGILAVLFNSRSAAEWQTLLDACERSGLSYRGRVPMAYSANSVVQDNREGALEHDFVVVFSRNTSFSIAGRLLDIAKLPQWSSARPE